MADNFPDISTIAVVDDSPLGQPTPNSLDSGDNVSTELAPLQQNSGAGSNDLPDKIPQSQLLASDLSESEMIAEFREQDSNLIDIINSMEADRNKFLAHVRTKISCKETEFEKTKSENLRLQSRIAEMELCLRQNNIDFVSAASTSKTVKSSKNASTASDDILTQAKALLFEKTKICKQQEQQLAALRTQVEATKEVLTVTKEMLCLRNIENDHTQARLETLDLKLKTERARQLLTEKKLASQEKMYADLRKEYELQSEIFKQLRSTYEVKISVLAKQLEAAKS